MSYRLFLDDDRNPQIVGNYFKPTEYRNEYQLCEWVIVRNYPDFIAHIQKHGMPTHLSLDHDLAPRMFLKHLSKEGVFNYEAADFDIPINRTGYHCAEWLLKYSRKNNLSMPIVFVHSLNPIGLENIKQLLKDCITYEC